MATKQQPKLDPDHDDQMDEPDPTKDGDDSVLAERYGKGSKNVSP